MDVAPGKELGTVLVETVVAVVAGTAAVELVVVAAWPPRGLAPLGFAVFVPPQAARANAKTTRTATATPPLILTTLVTLGRPSRFLLVRARAVPGVGARGGELVLGVACEARRRAIPNNVKEEPITHVRIQPTDRRSCGRSQ